MFIYDLGAEFFSFVFVDLDCILDIDVFVVNRYFG